MPISAEEIKRDNLVPQMMKKKSVLGNISV